MSNVSVVSPSFMPLMGTFILSSTAYPSPRFQYWPWEGDQQLFLSDADLDRLTNKCSLCRKRSSSCQSNSYSTQPTFLHLGNLNIINSFLKNLLKLSCSSYIENFFMLLYENYCRKTDFVSIIKGAPGGGVLPVIEGFLTSGWSWIRKKIGKIQVSYKQLHSVIYMVTCNPQTSWPWMGNE